MTRQNKTTLRSPTWPPEVAMATMLGTAGATGAFHSQQDHDTAVWARDRWGSAKTSEAWSFGFGRKKTEGC